MPGDHVCALLPDDIHPSCSFIFDKLLESELSRGSKKLDAFFPFDPCLLRSSNSFISGNFIYWSMVRPTYDDEDDGDEDAEIIVNGDEESDEEEEDDVDHVMDKMSITPKHSFMNEMERDRLLKMPSIGVKHKEVARGCLTPWTLRTDPTQDQMIPPLSTKASL